MSTEFPIKLHGTVVAGNKLGRKIDMPTANIIPIENIDDLAKGVYFSKVYTPFGVYTGITNVGTKPTVNNFNVVNVETFVYNFVGDLYGKDIAVELHGFRRPEQKFESFEKLSEQMHLDLEAGQQYWREHESESKN